MNTARIILSRIAPITIAALLGTACDAPSEPDFRSDELASEDADEEGIIAIYALDEQELTAAPRPTHGTLERPDSFKTPTHCPDPEDAGVAYASEDPMECATLYIKCAPGWSFISPLCGCGCVRDGFGGAEDLAELELDIETIDDPVAADDGVVSIIEVEADELIDLPHAPAPTHSTFEGATFETPRTCPDPDDEGVNYVSEDLRVCSGIVVDCAPGWSNIPAECGCGCEFEQHQGPTDLVGNR